MAFNFNTLGTFGTCRLPGLTSLNGVRASIPSALSVLRDVPNVAAGLAVSALETVAGKTADLAGHASRYVANPIDAVGHIKDLAADHVSKAARKFGEWADQQMATYEAMRGPMPAAINVSMALPGYWNIGTCFVRAVNYNKTYLPPTNPLLKKMRAELQVVMPSIVTFVEGLAGAKGESLLALEIRARMGDKIAAKSLRTLALGQTGTPEVRSAAAAVLGRVGEKEDLEALSAILRRKSTDQKLLEIVIDALGGFWSKKPKSESGPEVGIIASLVSLLQDASVDENCLGIIANALAENYEGEVEQALDRYVSHLGSEHLGMRLYALEMISKYFRNDEGAFEILKEFWLGEGRKDHVSVRCALAKAIGAIKDPRRISLLKDMACDQDAQVRAAVARAIRQNGHDKLDFFSAEEGLLEFLEEDKNFKVRCAAAETYGEFKSENARAALSMMARDKSYQVRCAVVKALGKISEHESVISLIRELMRLAADPRYEVRCLVAETFGRIHQNLVPQATKALENMIADAHEDDRVRSAAKASLAVLKDRVEEERLRSFDRLSQVFPNDAALVDSGDLRRWAAYFGPAALEYVLNTQLTSDQKLRYIKYLLDFSEGRFKSQPRV